MLKYILSGFLIYTLVGLGLFVFQRKFTYNRSGKPYKPSEYGLFNVSEQYIRVSKDLKLLSWYCPPRGNKPIIIYFHGNSFDIGERAYRVKEYVDDGYGILLPAYRGFSGNKGTPNETIIYKDSQIMIDWVKKKLSINDERIVLYGESLGTGVAIHLGQNKKYKSIILEAPFTSIVDIAKKMYPIYPVTYLVLDKFDNLSKINNNISPILFIHGKKDEIVPFNMGVELYKKTKIKKFNLYIDEAMHNNLYDYGIAKKIINFIEKI